MPGASTGESASQQTAVAHSHFRQFAHRHRGGAVGFGDHPQRGRIEGDAGKAQVVGTLAAVYGWFMAPIGWSMALLVCGYALVFFLIASGVKIAVYYTLQNHSRRQQQHLARIESRVAGG
jgi:hypothetical protein